MFVPINLGQPVRGRGSLSQVIAFAFAPSGPVLHVSGQNLHKGVLGRVEFILRFDVVVRFVRALRSVEVLHRGGSFFAKGCAVAAVSNGLHLLCRGVRRKFHWDLLSWSLREKRGAKQGQIIGDEGVSRLWELVTTQPTDCTAGCLTWLWAFDPGDRSGLLARGRGGCGLRSGFRSQFHQKTPYPD